LSNVNKLLAVFLSDKSNAEKNDLNSLF